MFNVQLLLRLFILSISGQTFMAGYYFHYAKLECREWISRYFSNFITFCCFFFSIISISLEVRKDFLYCCSMRFASFDRSWCQPNERTQIAKGNQNKSFSNSKSFICWAVDFAFYWIQINMLLLLLMMVFFCSFHSFSYA